MKQPSRGFLEEVSEQGDPELEQLFEGARELHEPSLESRQRVSKALRAALPEAVVPDRIATGRMPKGRVAPELNASLSTGSALRQSSLRSGGSAQGTGKWLVLGGALIGAAGFWLGHFVGYSDAERQRASAPLVGVATDTGAGAALADGEPGPTSERIGQDATPTPRLPSSDTGEQAEAPRPKALPTPTPKPSPAHERASAHADVNFRQVLDQLRRAEQHLRSGQSTVSLLLLSELDRHAGDVLWEERETARILALCASGQERRAKSAAAALRQRNRESIYATRLDESCAAPSVDAD